MSHEVTERGTSANPRATVSPSRAFMVGVTQDLRPTAEGAAGMAADPSGPAGTAALEALGLGMLSDEPRLRWDFITQQSGDLLATSVEVCDAVILLKPAVTEETLTRVERLCLIARWGVGYDNIDVDACTAAGVIVTITPESVRGPVASGAMAFILALAHRVVDKDLAARAAPWANRLDTLGAGLSGRVLGVVGLGNIGRDLLTLADPFGMRHLAADPYVSPQVAQGVGATLVELDELLETADIVCLTCALTPSTRHLINAERLARMKPDAVLVNVARGGLVDQAALVRALRSGTIRAAALDTLDPEPPDPDDPILRLDNVILAPHSIAWTDQLARGNTTACCQAIIDLLAGWVPQHVVNPAVLDSAVLRDKLNRHGIDLDTIRPEVTR